MLSPRADLQTIFMVISWIKPWATIDQKITPLPLQLIHPLFKEAEPKNRATTETLTARRIKRAPLKSYRHIKITCLQTESALTQRCEQVQTQADKENKKNVSEGTSAARWGPTNRQKKAAWKTTLEGLLRTNTKLTSSTMIVANRLMRTKLVVWKKVRLIVKRKILSINRMTQSIKSPTLSLEMIPRLKSK